MGLPMSVVIVGVHKSNCIGCICTDDDARYCWAAKRYIPMEGEPEFCPMVELPEHGDLIDKNRMIDVLHTGRKCVSELQKGAEDEKSISFCQGAMVGYTNSIVALDGAPVIIPAEMDKE